MKLFRYLRSFLPERLPVGVTEFHKWSDTVIELAGAPNNYTTKGALALMIIHQDADRAYRPKQFFVRSLIKSMASEVSHHLFIDFKNNLTAEQEAAKLAEATAIPVESANVESAKSQAV